MIEIVEPRAIWPQEYNELQAELEEAVGPAGLRIDHIGSTSVPGLAAKDILDVMLTVRAFSMVDALIEPLGRLGFRYMEQIQSDHPPAGQENISREWEKRLFNRYSPHRRTHLHIRAHGRQNQRYALLFRDYLRSHPRAAAGYAEVKRRLAAYHGNTDDHTAYVEIKDPVCDIIIAAAEDWAAQTGWSVR